MSEPFVGVVEGGTGYTEAELRSLWQAMLDRPAAFPLAERRLASMCVALVNQLRTRQGGQVMSNDDVIDIRRPEGLFLRCPTCGREISVPPSWRTLWAEEVKCIIHIPAAVMVEVTHG